jgi:hypothetical protein
MDERRRREVLAELASSTGMDFGDLTGDPGSPVAASAAIVQAGGPGALQTPPPVDTGPAPDYRTDPAGFVEWGFRTLAAVTQPRQHQEGVGGDGMPTDAGTAPDGTRPVYTNKKPPAPGPEPEVRMTPSGWPLPPVPPGTRDQGDAEQSPNRGKTLSPREPGSYGY